MKKHNKDQSQSPSDTVLISVLVPRPLLQELDATAKRQDLDRSKVIRQAIRQALKR